MHTWAVRARRLVADLALATLAGAVPAAPPVVPPIDPPASIVESGTVTTAGDTAERYPRSSDDGDGRSKSGRPDAARRVVRVFDFEEQRTNPTPVPRYWIRAQDDRTVENGTQHVSRNRPGFPSWNSGVLDYTSPAYRGAGSLKLPTSGGSTSLLLEPGVIPVFQSADYNVTAYIRTENVQHARARVIARLLDASGNPVEDGAHASTLVVSDGKWTPVSIDVEAKSDRAAFLELELQLLQPEQLIASRTSIADPSPAQSPAPSAAKSPAVLKPATEKPGTAPAEVPSAATPPASAIKRVGRTPKVYDQDLSGAAWFDDLTVTQLPRIQLSAGGVSSIIQRPEVPELHLEIRDLTGENLRAELKVFDVYGALIDSSARELGVGRVRAPWKPKITRNGWYRATLGVFNRTALVGQAMVDFIWLPSDDSQGPPGKPGAYGTRRLGVVIDEFPPSLVAPLPEVVRRLGIGSLTLPVQNLNATRETVGDFVSQTAASIDGVLGHGLDVMLAIDQFPQEFCAEHRADLSDPWAALRGDPAAWEPYLGPYFEKYGQRVRHWRVGRTQDDIVFWRPALASELGVTYKNLSRLLPGPTVSLPWRIDRAVGPKTFGPLSEHAQVSVLVPQEAPYESVTEFGERWKKEFESVAAPELSLVFESPPGDEYGYAAGLSELAKRTIAFWRTFDPSTMPKGSIQPPSAQLLNPWDKLDARSLGVRPKPELAAWSNLIRRLSDRRVAGELPIGPGIKCFILAPAPNAPEGRGGALVAWNESAPPESAVLRAYLGHGPIRTVDLFGNSAQAALDHESSDGPAVNDDGTASNRRAESVIAIGTEPVFIEGVDPLLMRFLASVRFDPPLLGSTNENHEHVLVFDNPWTTSMDLRAFIIKPGGVEPGGVKDRSWKISPRSGRSIVPPGQQGRIPITIAFSPAEEAGPKEFVLDFDVTADKAYGLIRLRTPLELGLEHVKLDLTSIVLPSGDVIVEAQVSNTGQFAVDVELTSFAPGQPRLKNQINRLPPGNQVVRRFPYQGGAKGLLGKRIFVAAADAETKARLNKSVMVE